MTFGAIRYKCNHVEENYRENDESNKKIEVSKGWTIYTVLNEIVKMQRTCDLCHYRIKHSVVVELPNVLTRKYDAIPPQAVSVYLDSSEGKSMLNDFNLEWHADDLLELTWQELQGMTSKFELALEDI